jgi:acylphosphatase
MTIAKRVIYSGRVQGVGFRYTAKGIANGFKVAGHVRNRPDGTVELLAQGAADQVEGFLGAIGRQMTAYVEDQETQDVPPTDAQTFTIIR